MELRNRLRSPMAEMNAERSFERFTFPVWLPMSLRDKIDFCRALLDLRRAWPPGHYNVFARYYRYTKATADGGVMSVAAYEGAEIVRSDNICYHPARAAKVGEITFKEAGNDQHMPSNRSHTLPRENNERSRHTDRKNRAD